MKYAKRSGLMVLPACRFWRSAQSMFPGTDIGIQRLARFLKPFSKKRSNCSILLTNVTFSTTCRAANTCLKPYSSDNFSFDDEALAAARLLLASRWGASLRSISVFSSNFFAPFPLCVIAFQGTKREEYPSSRFLYSFISSGLPPV